MRAILSPSPPPLPLLLRGNRARPSLPRCVYRPENAAGGGSFFPGGIGTSRADWQSSCAILASKVLATGQQQNQGGGGAGAGTFLSAGDNTHQSSDAAGPPPTVNGQKVVSSSSSSSSATLDLVHVDPNLPCQFSVADLSPAPMHGSQVRVAYQGVPGAYSEAAAGKAYPGCEAIPCDQFEVVFQAVEIWIADRAVLPVENSLGGSIHRNYDLLLRHRLHIVGEVQLPVHHCLLALPGVRPEHLTRVISHPQALSQCEHTLTAMGLRVAREAVYDTAGAAEMVAARGLRDTGAIASARAGELYGLEVVADGVQDEVGNVTRFMMLAREPIVPRTDRRFKTSIVFGQGREGTSVLFKVLSALAFRGIGLSKIESRPHRGRPIRVVDDANLGGSAMHFEYMFYVDFEASLAESRAQNALAEIHEFTSFLRVLGSYPMDLSPWPTPRPCSGSGGVNPSTSSSSSSS